MQLITYVEINILIIQNTRLTAIVATRKVLKNRSLKNIDELLKNEFSYENSEQDLIDKKNISKLKIREINLKIKRFFKCFFFNLVASYWLTDHRRLMDKKNTRISISSRM
jgi:hypothetical protein